MLPLLALFQAFGRRVLRCAIPVGLALGLVSVGTREATAQNPVSVTAYTGPTFSVQYWVCTRYCDGEEEQDEEGYYMNVYRLVYTIRNNSTTDQYPYLSEQCTSLCTSRSWVGAVLAPSQTRTAYVDFALPVSGSYSSTLTLSATQSNYSWCGNEEEEELWRCNFTPAGPWDSAQLTVSGSNGSATASAGIFAYRPTVTPKATPESIPFEAALSRSFTIQNAGFQSATYAIAASCGTMVGCTPSKTTTTLAAGATDNINVSFTSPSTTNTSNTIKLIATYSNGSQAIADTGLRPTVTPTVRPFVYPKNGTAVVGGPDAFRLTFTTNGWYSFTPFCQGWVTNCSIYPYYDDELETYAVEVQFSVPVGQGGPTYPTAKIGVIASEGAAADTGFVTASLAYAKPALSPKAASNTDPANSQRSYVFNLSNTGNISATYAVTIVCAGGVSDCSAPQLYVPVDAGTTTVVSGTYRSPPIGQTGTLKVIAAIALGFGTPPAPPDTGTITSTGADVLAPTISFPAGLPPENGLTSFGALSVTVSACDPDGQLTDPVITRNGSTVSASYTSTNGSGCNTKKDATVSLVAQPGNNTVVVSVGDGIHTTTVTRHFTYNEANEARPVVTYQQQSRLLRDGVQASDTFFVRNPGPIPITYSLTQGCTAVLSGCVVNASTLTVGAGQTEKMWITYTTTAMAAGAAVWPIVRYTTVGGTLIEVSDVYTSVIIDRITPTIALTAPTNGETIDHFPTVTVDWCDADGQLQIHTVTIDGVPLAANFASQTVSGCTSAGTSSWSNVNLTLGAHTLAARATDVSGHDTTITRTFTLALPAVAEFRPEVTPKTPAWLIPHPQQHAWAVRNVGTRTAIYHIVADCSELTVVAGCTLDKNDFSVAPNAVDTVRVSFALASLPAGPKTLKLIASYTDIVGRVVADTGIVDAQIPSVATLYQPQVAGPAGTIITEPSDPPVDLKIRSFYYQITNVGIAPVTYTTTVSTSGGYGWAPWNQPESSVTVNPGESVDYHVALVPPPFEGAHGSATLTVSYTMPGVGTVSASAVIELATRRPNFAMAFDPIGGPVRVVAQPDKQIFRILNTGDLDFHGTARVSCTPIVFQCRFDGAPPGTDEKTLQVVSEAKEVSSLAVAFNLGGVGQGTITVTLEGTASNSTPVTKTASITLARSGSYSGVTVSPHDETRTIRANRNVYWPFIVTNVGAAPDSFAIAVSCTTVDPQAAQANVSCQNPSRTTRRLQPGSADTIPVDFHTNEVGSLGLVALTATSVFDPATTDIGKLTVTLGTPVDIDVVTQSVNPEQVVAKDKCLIISAGENAAYECGDLRIVHPLPATTTMNKTRAPALVYNSAHALGHAVVAADVTVALGVNPSQVRVTLKVKNAAGEPAVDTSRVITWDRTWSDGSTRRVAMGFNAPAGLLGTGKTAAALSYTFEVQSVDSANVFAQDAGTIIMVDRSASPFGSGWWLDGLEQLVSPADTTQKLLWVGGDGTARVYTKQSAGVWTVFPTMDRPDTILKVAATNGYRRKLPNGAYVEFDYAGRHVETKNVQDHVTTFAWNETYNVLDSISLPMPIGSAATRVYRFNYDATSHRLTSVVAPAAPAVRQVIVHPTLVAGKWVVDRITDADQKGVGFGFDAAGRVTARTNRLSFTTSYEYDEGGSLKLSSLDMAGTGEAIVHKFCAAETASLTTCADGVPKLAGVRTWYDGARSDLQDTTAFYLNRFGAPVTIVNALGYVTEIERNDSKWPLLATAVVQPNRHRVETRYDSVRAVPVRTTDRSPLGSADAITRYFWNPTLQYNLADSIVGPSGEVTRFDYYANGERKWQEDGRGDTSRVSFDYNGNRQLATIRPAGNSATQLDSLDYDELGNLKRSVSAGGATTKLHRDGIGRADSTYALIAEGQWRTTGVLYDVMDRVKVQRDSGGTVTYSLDGGANTSAPAVTLVVTNQYDDNGNLLFVTRESMPDLAGVHSVTLGWTYDGAGRKRTATDAHNEQESWTYDEAGNLKTWAPRRPLPTTINSTYDALNRLRTRTTPAVSYNSQTEPFSNTTFKAGFPHFAPNFAYDFQFAPTNLPPALQIAGDAATFDYDENGNMILAVNTDAKITRDYYPNGALKDDVLRTAIVDSASTPYADRYSQHTYALHYTYDLSGRRLTRTDNIPGCSPCTQQYHYNPVSGFLEWTSDKGATFAFKYDSAGRVKSHTVNTNAVFEGYSYDLDGQRVGRSVTSSALGNVYGETLQYDFAGHITKATVFSDLPIQDDADQVYNGLGALAGMKRVRSGVMTWVDEYRTDAMGNASKHYRWANGARDTTSFNYSGERLLGTSQTAGGAPGAAPPLVNQIEDREDSHDLSGNVVFTQRTLHRYLDAIWLFTMAGMEKKWSAYDAEDRLRVVQRTFFEDSIHLRTVFMEYRYDALGRRILSRTRWDQTCEPRSPSSPAPETCKPLVERTIWDGDQVLAELRNAAALTVVTDSSEGCIHDPDIAAPADTTCRRNYRYYQDSVSLELESTPGPFSGAIRYTHAGGIDEPLALWRSDFDSGLVPHQSWRGVYEAGSFLGSATPVSWPGRNLDPFGAHDFRLDFIQPSHWLGSVVSGANAGSGLVYKRNRYYDPSTGRFTQEDPIGLAGGMNLYGFASGDPVNHSDPFGLCDDGKSCPDKNLHEAGFDKAADLAGSAFGALIGFAKDLLTHVGLFAATEGTGTAARIIVDEAKLGYMFGAATGRVHNVARAGGNARELAKIGILESAGGREVMRDALGAAAGDSRAVLSTFANEYGSYQVRETLLAGPIGFAKLHSTWQQLPDGGLRFISAIVKGSK